jgi:hypothetical protein
MSTSTKISAVIEFPSVYYPFIIRDEQGLIVEIQFGTPCAGSDETRYATGRTPPKFRSAFFDMKRNCLGRLSFCNRLDQQQQAQARRLLRITREDHDPSTCAETGILPLLHSLSREHPQHTQNLTVFALSVKAPNHQIRIAPFTKTAELSGDWFGLGGTTKMTWGM